jgi:hypothetical protein
MTINVDQGGAIITLFNEMGIPQFVVKGFASHREPQAIRFVNAHAYYMNFYHGSRSVNPPIK